MKTALSLFALVVSFSGVALFAAAPTTINDFSLAGSQPNQSGNIEGPDRCDNCHGGYDIVVEPAFNWRGSMMANAQRDPLYLACLTIANQDAPNAGDLCIRCHSPSGWLDGRSEPTDGSALNSSDRESVHCDVCHKLVAPTPLGVNPFPGDTDYTTGTYGADQTYLSILTDIPPTSANGMFILDDDGAKRGPYTDPEARHQFFYSPFHKEAALCGTCHDVSNPVYSRTTGMGYAPNDFDAPTTDFSPYSQFPIERTFSEWLMSAYNTPTGVYAPQFGGNLDTVRTCQDCHMRDTTGVGCNKAGAPVRDDLAIHDMTGGNTFIPLMLPDMFPGEVDNVAIDSGIVRATNMLRKAASLDAVASVEGDQYRLDVTVTNETGHKLPSGYPEGRRIWLNVIAYSASGTIIYESGAYDAATAVLSHDADAKIYEIKPGLSNGIAPVLGLTPGPSFHFAVNDTIYFDNRIPPRGFTNANFDSIQSPPIGYSYPDGQYWDETSYLIPGSADSIDIVLFYQTTSKEYVEFLRDENVTNEWGDSIYALWNNYGKSLPVVMNSATLDVTPLVANEPPVLAAIGAKSVDEGLLLEFIVSATDPDGTIPALTTSEPLPTGALFTDHGDGTGTFSWTSDFDQAGEYEVTFTASDGEASDSELVPITVNNLNRSPVLDPIGDKAVASDVLLQFRVSASDPDGFTPLLTTSTLPTGSAFVDSGNGAGSFSWTPTLAQLGQHEVTFFATDDLDAQDSELITINVSETNLPPEIAPVADTGIPEGSELVIIVSATDPNSDPLAFTGLNLPTNSTLIDNGNNTSTFTFAPDYDQAGSYQIGVVASDGSLADSTFFWVTATNTNRVPQLSDVPDQVATVDVLLQFVVSATDPDDDPIFLSVDPLPQNASFTDHGDGTSTFSWTPSQAQAGDHELVFLAADGVSLAEDTCVITVTLDNCCIGERGNILIDEPGTSNCENTVDQTVDIGDLTSLVNHLFISFDPLCCEEEADLAPKSAPDGVVDIGDLTELVNHLFITFQPLISCQ